MSNRPHTRKCGSLRPQMRRWDIAWECPSGEVMFESVWISTWITDFEQALFRAGVPEGARFIVEPII